MLKERSKAWGIACAALALTLLALLYSVRTYGLNTQERTVRPSGADDRRQRAPSAGPDQETAAYAGISKIADPAMRLEALKDFAARYPGSSRAATVQNQILDTLIRHFPDREGEIAAQTRQMIEAAPERRPAAQSGRKTGPARDLVCNLIATKLMDAGILLAQAEAIARQGLSLLNENSDPSGRLQKIWAAQNATLGQICLNEGKFDEAARVFGKSYRIDPTLAVAAAGLGEAAERNGRYEQAQEYFASAVLAGRSSDRVRKQLETVYARLHEGTLDGLEEMLDARYRDEFSAPIRIESYNARRERNRRVVLAEVFTGSGCPSCVAADLAFEAAMKRYSPSDFSVLMYHVHIPQPDPMTNLSTLSRSRFYKVRAVPSMFIDGAPDGKGGGSRDDSAAVYERINPGIEKRLEVGPEARIALEAVRRGSEVRVKASVDQVKSSSGNLKLQIALVEDELRYTGENGIRLHPMVVRSLAGPAGSDPNKTHGGFAVGSAKIAPVDYTFDLVNITAELKTELDDYELNGAHGRINFRQKMYEIDPDQLLVVAFLQDETTKQVLQALSVPVLPEY